MNKNSMIDEPGTGDEVPQGKEAEKVLSWKDKSLRFLVGFLGWYLVTGLIYISLFPKYDPSNEAPMICGGVLFPVNGVVFIILMRKWPLIGWGMLSALAVNSVISLILGLWTNAFCFRPFFAQ